MYMMEATLARVNRRVEYPPAATAPPLSLSPYPWWPNPTQLDTNSSDFTKLALSPFCNSATLRLPGRVSICGFW
jgi:hypothetical protein